MDPSPAPGRVGINLVWSFPLRHAQCMKNPINQPIDRLAQIVDDLHAYLTAEKEEGLTTVELEAGQLVGLRDWFTSSGDASLAAIAAQIAVCVRCDLCKTRNRTVPGQGHPHPEVVFIGEGPGAEEDAQGVAFVGRAGQLLTKIIESMGLTRDEVWIGNVVKCRPPNNRAPTPEEMGACLPYLREQIALLKPKVIVCLGATAVKGLFDKPVGISKLRGQWLTFEGIAAMPTFHPAYLLRNPAAKREVWEDMKTVLKRLGREPPPR